MSTDTRVPTEGKTSKVQTKNFDWISKVLNWKLSLTLTNIIIVINFYSPHK